MYYVAHFIYGIRNWWKTERGKRMRKGHWGNVIKVNYMHMEPIILYN
jgi:hypothetical protein